MVRGRQLMKRYVSVLAFRFATKHFKATTDLFKTVIPRFGEVARHLKSKTRARCQRGSNQDPEYVVVSHVFSLCAKRYGHANLVAIAAVTVSQLSHFRLRYNLPSAWDAVAPITWTSGLIRGVKYPFGSSSRNKLSS